MYTSPTWCAGGPEQSQLKKPLAPIDFLRGHPAFRQLPANALEQIRSHFIRKRVQRGALIFAQGDPGTRWDGQDQRADHQRT